MIYSYHIFSGELESIRGYTPYIQIYVFKFLCIPFKKNESNKGICGYTLAKLSSTQNNLKLLNFRFFYNNVTCM